MHQNLIFGLFTRTSGFVYIRISFQGLTLYYIFPYHMVIAM